MKEKSSDIADVRPLLRVYRWIKFFYQPDTYHPDKQHHENDQDNTSRYATGDVEEFGLLHAMFACEAAAASARRLPARILQADALIVAVAQTYVRAYSSGAVVSGLTFAFEIASLRYE